MGWKSTVYITREEAIMLIISRVHLATDEELTDLLENIGYGDNFDLKYFGHNFLIRDKEEDDTSNY